MGGVFAKWSDDVVGVSGWDFLIGVSDCKWNIARAGKRGWSGGLVPFFVDGWGCDCG